MRTSDERGFSLLEILIVASVLVLLVGGAFALLGSASDAQALGTAHATLERNATSAVERIAREIALGGSNTFSPAPASPNWCDAVAFETPNGPADASAWGEIRGIALIRDPNDPDDGVDNDGDGLIDECLLVLETGPDSSNVTRTVLARNVREYLEVEEPNGQDDNGNGLIDESGLCLTCDGGVWTVRLTLERRGPRGELVTRTVTTSASPRNSK